MRGRANLVLTFISLSVASAVGDGILQLVQDASIRIHGFEWLAVFAMFGALSLGAVALATKLTPQETPPVRDHAR